MVLNMLQCNCCANHSCHPDYRGYTPEMHRTSCPNYKPLQPFKCTIFELAITKNVQGLATVLDSLDMEIKDSGRYPYFKIVYNPQRKRR